MTATWKIDVVAVRKGHALAFEQLALHIRAAEGKAVAKAPVGEDDPMAGHLGTGTRVRTQGEPHVTGRPRATHRTGNVAIGCNATPRNLPHRIVDFVEEPAHALMIPYGANRDAGPRSLPRGKREGGETAVMRILMLGNSLTTANGLPDLLAHRLQAETVVHARGGARLSEHLNPKTRLGAKTRDAFAQGGWDYVFLQERSDGPIRFKEGFLHSTQALADAARASGATPILYATWAYAPECPKLEKLGLTHDIMHERMHEANLQAAEQSGALLADVCLAFHEQRGGTRRPYAADGVHPSETGTHIALETFVNVIEAHTPSPDSPVPDNGNHPYTVYLLECTDGSYYAGITTDVERRLQEHLSRGPKAAKYTRTHPVTALAATWRAADRAEASRLEYRIKQLSHAQKAALAANPSRIAEFYNSAG